ncbi:RNA-binding protein [Actinomyces sp.]|jgi:putative U4/U6.U5 tri-snRNP-associated protein snu66
MKRRIAAVALVALLPLGMAACGAQSKADACNQLKSAMSESSSALLAVSQDPTSKDTYVTLAEAYEAASKKITNTEIKPAVDQVAADWRNLADHADALASMDPAKTVEFTQIAEDLNTHQNALLETCGLPNGGK